MARLPDDGGYALCHECPTLDADGPPFKSRDVEDRQVPARAPAAASRAPLRPTADDFLNLYFCETSEEEEAGAGPLAAVELSLDDAASDDAASARTTAAASASSATTASTKRSNNKRKRRQVSFIAAPPTVHLLADTPPCHAMTPEERSAVWFSRSDLEAIKSSAQRSIKRVRDRVHAGRSGGAAVGRRSEFRALMVAMEDETGSSIRGLEHRVFRRKEVRRDLIRDVLECQSHVAGLARFGHAMKREESARLLVRVSQDRSLKARRVAYVDARDDRREVFGDDDAAGGDGVGAQRALKNRKRRPEEISF